MNPRNSVLFAAMLALGGCASGPPPKPLIVESANQTLSPPPPDRAQIVFLEPINSIQGLLAEGIFEVNGNDRTLLAGSTAHSKVAVLLPAGHHMLMVDHSGMIAHYLDADVEAGKRYYVLLRFIYANGFQMRPLRTSGPSDYTIQNKEFPDWISSTHFVDLTPDGNAFFEQTLKVAVGKSQAAAWKTWLAKTPGERAELTLNPGDAVAP